MLTTVKLTPASADPDRWQTLGTQHAAILDRLREQPGVVSAGSSTFLPMEHGWRGPFMLADQPPGRREDRPQAQHHSISEGYFETMGATLLEGPFDRTGHTNHRTRRRHQRSHGPFLVPGRSTEPC